MGTNADIVVGTTLRPGYTLTHIHSVTIVGSNIDIVKNTNALLSSIKKHTGIAWQRVKMVYTSSRPVFNLTPVGANIDVMVTHANRV